MNIVTKQIFRSNSILEICLKLIHLFIMIKEKLTYTKLGRNLKRNQTIKKNLFLFLLFQSLQKLSTSQTVWWWMKAPVSHWCVWLTANQSQQSAGKCWPKKVRDSTFLFCVIQYILIFSENYSSVPVHNRSQRCVWEYWKCEKYTNKQYTQFNCLSRISWINICILGARWLSG